MKSSVQILKTLLRWMFSPSLASSQREHKLNSHLAISAFLSVLILQNEATLTSGAGGGGDTSTAGAQPPVFVTAGRGETSTSPSHPEKEKEGDS